MQSFFGNLRRKTRLDNLPFLWRAATYRWLGYLLFVTVLGGLLVFYKFPYESLENKLKTAIEKRWSLKSDLTNLRPTMPPVLAFNEFSLKTLDYRGVEIFHATKGYLRPQILPLFGGNLVVTVRTEAYGGFFSGDIALKPFYKVRNYRLKASWHAIQLESQPVFRHLLERQISGRLSGKLELNGSLKEFASTSGSGEIKLIEGSFPIKYPYWKVETLNRLEVKAAIKLDGGELEISNCRFRADGLECTLEGTVRLRSRLYESVLDISGECKVDPSLIDFSSRYNKDLLALLDRNKSLPFHLRGTVIAPRLNLF